jgi:hypothetical protein
MIAQRAALAAAGGERHRGEEAEVHDGRRTDRHVGDHL